MKTDYTHVTLVADASGSMALLTEDVIGGLNGLLEEQQGKDTTISLFTFSDKVEQVWDFEVIKKELRLTSKNYKAQGMTALYDAIGVAIDRTGRKLAEMKEANRPSKVVVAIFTDGQENSSREYKQPQVKAMCEHQETQYQWEILFLGANIDVNVTADSLGITNRAAYTANSKGMESAYRIVSQTISK